MKNGERLKDWALVAGTVRHTVALAVVVVTGVVSVTLLYAQVNQTEKKAKSNEEQVEVLKRSLNQLGVQQQVIIQQIKDEKEDGREFRARTDRSLDRILDKLQPNN